MIAAKDDIRRLAFYTAEVWQKIIDGYNVRPSDLTMTQRKWMADFIHDALVDEMPSGEAAFRIVNERSRAR